MEFEKLTSVFDKVERTASRLSMADELASLFKSCSASEIPKVIYLCQGSIAPPHEGIDLGIGEKFVMEAIALSCGYKREQVEKEYKKLGDLGLVAETFLSKKAQLSLSSEQLTVSKVFSSFLKLAKMSGTGSQEAKIKALAELLNSASPQEARYIARFAVAKLRLGIGDSTIIDALSVVKAGDKSLHNELERAYNLCNDLGFVAETFFTSPEKIAKFHPIVFKPIRPALAERAADADEIIERMVTRRLKPAEAAEEGEPSGPAHDGKCSVEAKYDGFRMQVHKSGEHVEIFSRKQERMTKMFPDIIEAVRKLKAKEVIFEGEALAYNEKEKRYYSFQQTMQRRRKHHVGQKAEELPLRLFAFDILYIDGKDCTGLEYEERRKKTEALVKGNPLIVPSERIMASNAKQLMDYFNECLARGLEGIIAKDLKAPYTAGARKFAWIKLKKSYGLMADTIDGVICGYYLGKGARAEFEFGGLLIAVLNEDTGRFETVARIGSGFSEDEMNLLKGMLDKIKRKEKPKELDSDITPDFWTDLKYVVTVAADEITLSSMHTCGKGKGDRGYALRFPRMMALRDDKGAQDATTTAEVISIFEIQRRKGAHGEN